MGGAKRVILRVPETDMNYENPREFVDLYFKEFPSDAALDSARHFIHYQPPSDIRHSDARVHIVIDLETLYFAGTLDQGFPHEIYAVRRDADTGDPALYAYTESVKQDILQKVREYSDDLYPWGQSRGDSKDEVE